MKSRVTTLLWMLLALAAGAWARPVLAQDVADKPDLRVGDTWMFHATGDNDGTAVDYGWRRRIVELLPGGRMRVTPRNPTDLFDDSWNPIYADRPDFPSPNLQFPLRVGAAWSYASPTGAMTLDGRNYDHRGHMRVMAYESITVPAGTFKCFRIEGEVDWVNSYGGGDADFRYASKSRTTNWYCPEVRNIGKSHTEQVAVGSYVKGVYRTLHNELVAHARGGTIPMSAPSSASASSVGDAQQQSPFDGTWEGEQGTWRIKGRVAGDSIEGTIRCRANDKWGGTSPMFHGAVEKDGSVAALTTEDIQGWAPRQITGKLPNLRVIGFGKLTCPNGEIAMKKVG